MESGIFWDVFESTGSIEAYLTYSKSEHYFSETYNIGGVSIDENQKTRKRKKTKSDSEYS
jgi:hypothetical protein